MKHKVLCAKYVEELVANCPISPNVQETTINKVDITPSVILRFLLLQIPSKKTMKRKSFFWKIWCCLLVKGFHCWGLLNPFGSKGVYKLCLCVAFSSRNVFCWGNDFKLDMKNFGWVCPTCNNFMFVYNLYLCPLNPKRGTWHICRRCEFPFN